MDPYQTLGVPRGCTPEAVKDAFRARAWHAHPDRGGEETAFIRLCTAYKQVLEELDLNPRPGTRNPARPARDGRHRRSPIPNWDPDLVVLPIPPDPSWDPDLVVLDEPSRDHRSPDPQIARERYVAWLGRLSAQAARAESVWQSGWVRAAGTLLVLSLVLANLWVCWIAWTHDPRKAASAPPHTAISSQDAEYQADMDWAQP